ncbi:MAG TPA: hypothetical protein VIV60_34425 [Polyangiaceae bacterium]
MAGCAGAFAGAATPIIVSRIARPGRWAKVLGGCADVTATACIAVDGPCGCVEELSSEPALDWELSGWDAAGAAGAALS